MYLYMLRMRFLINQMVKPCWTLFDKFQQCWTGNFCPTALDGWKSQKSAIPAHGGGFWVLFDVLDTFDGIVCVRKNLSKKDEPDY